MEYTRRTTWKGYRRASYIGLAMGALFLLGGLVSESGVRMLVALAIGSAFLWAGYGVLVGKALARYVLVGLFGLFAAVILANLGANDGLRAQIALLIALGSGTWWLLRGILFDANTASPLSSDARQTL